MESPKNPDRHRWHQGRPTTAFLLIAVFAIIVASAITAALKHYPDAVDTSELTTEQSQR